VADIDHRDHATIELAIRDLKDQARAHFPSDKCPANSAWTMIAAITLNLAPLGDPDRPPEPARADRHSAPPIGPADFRATDPH
jgi:hypothetical protein